MERRASERNSEMGRDSPQTIIKRMQGSGKGEWNYAGYMNNRGLPLFLALGSTWVLSGLAIVLHIKHGRRAAEQLPGLQVVCEGDQGALVGTVQSDV